MGSSVSFDVKVRHQGDTESGNKGAMPIKVLHLARAAAASPALTAHSFIDEEILALRDAGVKCWLVSGSPGPSEYREHVPVVTLTKPVRLTEIADVAIFGAMRVRHLMSPALWRPRTLFRTLRFEHTAAQLVLRERIDLIHSHFGWPAGFGGTLAGAQTGVPVVASLRGMDLLADDSLGYGLRSDGFYDRAIARLLRTAARTVYATEFMRREGVAAGAPRDRTAVVRKGVDLERFRPSRDRPSAQRSLGLGSPVILAVGQLRPRKGYRTILGALAELTSLSWTLVICGEGPDRPFLEALARTLAIADRIRFAGSVSRADVARYFAAADIFVHAAILEAAGNVVLEGLASGCAVVATDSGGPAEYVCDGETGLVVPPENRTALAAVLRRLLQQPGLRQRLSAAARRHAEAELSYGRMVSDLIALYDDVISAARCATRPAESVPLASA